MDFESRIKKEMSEGIVRAILEDAQYRVIDSGIEKVLRELSCMSAFDYAKLCYPEAMSRLPDFTVMNRDQSVKFLVEVKYRSQWGLDLFEEVRPQVELFGELVLVSINANPPNDRGLYLPSTFLRCCRLAINNGHYQVQLRFDKDGERWHYWKSINEVNPKSLWWGMSPLDMVFTQLSDATLDTRRSLETAIRALSGILADPPAAPAL